MKLRGLCVFCILSLLVFQACTFQKEEMEGAIEPFPAVRYPDTRFAVISDLHYYDTALGTEGKAFDEYLDRDRKLLLQSDEIIATAVERISKDPAQFVLVSGDLTKDGEAVCHKKVAGHLDTLRKAGKKVFVVPGNHDINNPESFSYRGGQTLPEPGVSAGDFEEIYQAFGFGQAIARDTSSLSYVAEPVSGLWLLALDSNKYRENRPGGHPKVGGAFSDETLSWIRGRLTDARKSGKAVIVFLHHGIMEHYPANEKFYDEYMVEDYKEFSSLLARFGVQIVFTGHWHSQDITYSDVETGRGCVHRIFDIETGSLVTAPCPYRIIDIKSPDGARSRAAVSSHFIRSIPSMGGDFEAYAQDFLIERTKRLVNKTLSKYFVSEDQFDLINWQVARAYAANLNGDEKKPEIVLDRKGFGLWLRFVVWMQEDLIDGWWTDLPPEDNDLIIDLGPVTSAQLQKKMPRD